jgi:hypothetical protein
MNAPIPIRTPLNREDAAEEAFAALDAAKAEARRWYDDALAKAVTPYERERARQEYATRLPTGWIMPKPGAADEAVRGLISDAELLGLQQGARRFERNRRGGGR